jgi:hypothetical protein
LAQIDSRPDSSDIVSPTESRLSHHDSRTAAEQLKTGGAPSFLFGSDMLLRSICDWAIFESKLLNAPELRLPYTFISKELVTEGWKNIPIPIVEALDLVKETFHNTENIIIALCREQKTRSEAIAKKFKNELKAS